MPAPVTTRPCSCGEWAQLCPLAGWPQPLALPGNSACLPSHLPQVLKGRLALLAPIVSCGNFRYEEGDDLDEEEVRCARCACCGCRSCQKGSKWGIARQLFGPNTQHYLLH